MNTVKNTIFDDLSPFFLHFPLDCEHKDVLSEVMKDIAKLSEKEELPEEDTNPFYRIQIKVSDALLDIRDLY